MQPSNACFADRGFSQISLKGWLGASASSVVLLFSNPAFAQDSATITQADASLAGNNSADTPPGDIVVTGTRVVRDGYKAPTPLTVISEQDLLASAPSNVADFVNDIPSVQGSTTVQNGNGNISAGTAGINALNLRALGTNRTLVLLDGQRSVGSTLTGEVDVNTFPQGLIKGVEIVTGGASAAYGSDAISGVVNFILDKDFTGLKGSAEYGMTTYGDDDQYRLNLTAGIGFGGGRGKLLLNGEIVDRDGIYGVPRNWNNNGYYIIANPGYAPGNGQPERLVTYGAGPVAAPGGVILTGPLAGTAFGEGGAVYRQATGTTSGPWMIGGDWRRNQANNASTLDASDRRKGAFGRLSYEIFDDIEAFAQLSYNESRSYGWAGRQYSQGNLTFQPDNAFLPADVRAQLRSPFTMSSSNGDFPVRGSNNRRQVFRLVTGLNGKVSAFGTEWRWDGYYQFGQTKTHESVTDVGNIARTALARDAVFAPAGNRLGVPAGTIVCRSTLTNPANGCVPLNSFGIGVASASALDYANDDIWRKQQFTQTVTAFNISGNPFSTWAGEVSIATGIEHRTEKVSGEVPLEYRSGWFLGNFLPNFGRYSVTEGYLETVVPLMENLDFNGAIRATDYSTSGYVTTWKAGLSYVPVEGVRFRATRSRDIRAPNLNELFAAGTSRTNLLLDPFQNRTSVQFSEVTTGNPNLKPEMADTWGIGVVLQPLFLSGFAVSVDYYDIKLKGAIGAVDAQRIVDRCFAGAAEFCAAIQRTDNVLTRVDVSPFNFAERRAQGIDVDASYRFDLGGGKATLRGLATYYIKNRNDNGIDPVTDTAGSVTLPRLSYRATATWAGDPWTIQLVGRGVSGTRIDNNYVVCSTNCPATTAFNPTINFNKVKPAFYMDASITYDLNSSAVKSAQLFFNVNNLLNADPQLVPSGPSGFAWMVAQTNPGVFDVLGRVFRAGIRFQM